MTKEQISEIYYRPLISLVTEAAAKHQSTFPNLKVQASALLSIKTGGCPENCSYCPQSAHYKTGVAKTKLLSKKDVLEAALGAKNLGASRFCMGAAWREVKDGAEFDQVCELVKAVASLDLEVCCTLGMLTEAQAYKLKMAGLHFYNHNIDTSPEYYKKIIQTRSFADRLETIENVRKASIMVCTGGILGMGESEEDRIAFIEQLVKMSPQPESITINTLVPITGTPLENSTPIDTLDLVRAIATLRLTAPQSMIRLSAGRNSLTEEAQFLCFLVGANSIFLGEKLLTSPNPDSSMDFRLLKKSGLNLSNIKNYENN